MAEPEAARPIALVQSSRATPHRPAILQHDELGSRRAVADPAPSSALGEALSFVGRLALVREGPATSVVQDVKAFVVSHGPGIVDSAAAGTIAPTWLLNGRP
jgi:hypothetical protein